MADKKPAKKAPAKKKPAAKKPAAKKAPAKRKVRETKVPGRPRAPEKKDRPATEPLPKPNLPKPSKVVKQPLKPTGGKTLLDLLRAERDNAAAALSSIKKSLNHMHRWKGETWRHYFRRRHLLRRKRKNKRKIMEGFQGRIDQAVERKEDRKEEKRDDAKKKNPYDAHGGDIVTFDGKPCVEWIAHDLYKARQHGWNGILVSGYRSPEYSQQLCYNMCGAPSCPGRCAGTSSNHTRKGDGQGAADITDYINGERILYETGSRLHNNLPADLVHMSASGN